nr:uncharacterized protein LOC127321347 [Lolium perenne]
MAALMAIADKYALTKEADKMLANGSLATPRRDHHKPAEGTSHGSRRDNYRGKRNNDKPNRRYGTTHEAAVSNHAAAGGSRRQKQDRPWKPKFTFEQMLDTSCKYHNSAKPANHTTCNCNFTKRLNSERKIKIATRPRSTRPSSFPVLGRSGHPCLLCSTAQSICTCSPFFLSSFSPPIPNRRANPSPFAAASRLVSLSSPRETRGKFLVWAVTPRILPEIAVVVRRRSLRRAQGWSRRGALVLLAEGLERELPQDVSTVLVVTKRRHGRRRVVCFFHTDSVALIFFDLFASATPVPRSTARSTTTTLRRIVPVSLLLTWQVRQVLSIHLDTTLWTTPRTTTSSREDAPKATTLGLLRIWIRLLYLWTLSPICILSVLRRIFASA